LDLESSLWRGGREVELDVEGEEEEAVVDMVRKAGCLCLVMLESLPWAAAATRKGCEE